MKKITLTLSLIILSSLLFSCTGNTAPEPTLSPTATSQEAIPTDTEAPTATATSSPLTTPIPNENGLTIEENEIIGEPSLEPLTFTPVHGSQQDILERHAAEKGEQYSFGIEIAIDSNRKHYVASESDDDQGGMIVTVSLDGEMIFEVDAGDISPINPLQSFWVEEGHWTLEIAYVNTSSEDFFVVGKVYQDGLCLNEEYGYEEIFGYQLLASKPFFFYKLDEKIHLSYDGETLPIGYDKVHHYNCCSGAMLNPVMGSNWVGFWGVREGVTYYTEIGRY